MEPAGQDRAVTETGWPARTTWWHVYPMGALGAEPAALPDADEVRRRLPRLHEWLPYARGLGCDGLLLGPILASETHGYDTVDHFRVDRRLGDEGDLVALVEAAHAAGLRVVLDGVFNHVGRGFARYGEAVAGGPSSEAASWFRLDWPEDWTPSGGAEPEPQVFEGHDRLVVLDHSSPAVADHVVAVMRYWLERGVDGWRLDAAYAVPAAFWARVLPRVREHHPDAWFVGEVIHGDYAGYVAESGLDSVTQYELWKAVWSSLNDANAHELAHALGRHADFAEVFLPQTFVGNHDVTRIASRLDDSSHVAHALVVLATVAGSPSVYYLDELGVRGVKEEREGGDDAVRPELPARPPAPDDLDAGARATYDLTRGLLALRAERPWLATSRTEVLLVDAATIAYRSTGDGEALTVLLNAGDEPYGVDERVPAGPVLAAGDPEGAASDPRLVPPHGWTVLDS
jgi:cyclomaltodextrinase / maltogenic alpha-amylase / neopullulanase